MKIYIASSWKNYDYLIDFANLLRRHKHKVDLFCDKSTGRFVFKLGTANTFFDINSYISCPLTQRVFHENKKWISWSDTVIMVLPCGKSSYLEAGYAKGLGKKLIIFGNVTERDAMYLLADRIFKESQLNNLLVCLKKGLTLDT